MTVAQLSAIATLGLAGCVGPSHAAGTSGGNELARAVPRGQRSSATLVENALPYTLEFVVVQPDNPSSPAPGIQSYSHGQTKDGRILVVGGRIQGLHMFTSDRDNFPRSSSNIWLTVIDAKTGASWSFDTTKLGPDLSGPLSATNAQYYHDPATDQMIIIGGYGWVGDVMKTYETILRFPVTALADYVQSKSPDVDAMKALFRVDSDPRFAVTGGTLKRLGDVYYLLFGQRFDGQYRAFGGSDFKQTYTEQIAMFTLQPNSLKILSWTPLKSADPSAPYHRRDGNVVDDIDPATGNARIAAFGGVFQPGKIAAYTNPIYIDSSGPTIDLQNNQLFSQYQCPVIVAYDPNAKISYHTFFAGISGTWFFQTPAQHSAYELVTAEGRNDGFPFIADITSYVQRADGSFTEWILPDPTPQNQLIGASLDFILASDLVSSGAASPQGVIRLDKWEPGERKRIGVIFGGILADNPLPLRPNSGTRTTNQLINVYLTLTPSAAYPASEGTPATQSKDLLFR